MTQIKFNEALCEEVKARKACILFDKSKDSELKLQGLVEHIYTEDKALVRHYLNTKDNNTVYLTTDPGFPKLWTFYFSTDLPSKPLEDFILPDLPVKEEAKEKEFFLPPDEGEGWNIGAETFTRQEVFNLLYTQRAMISNDIKRECNLDNEPVLLSIINKPRIPKF